MSHSPTERPLFIKILTIIGFSATIILIGWLLLKLAVKAPETFSSLATITENIDTYRPLEKLILTPEKKVVHVHDTTKITWEDTKNEGVYSLTFVCTDVTLAIKNERGDVLPIVCKTAYKLPAQTFTLSVTVLDAPKGFSDIKLTLSFTDSRTNETISAKENITVVNADLVSTTGGPRPETTMTRPTTTIPSEIAEKPSVQKNEVIPHTPSTKQTYTTYTYYPQSDPHGFTDLALHTQGIGIIENGTFRQSDKYSNDTLNALIIDIENIGTKTSNEWYFTTRLPDGTVYTSPTQTPLKPKEHGVFTLTFGVAVRSGKTTTTSSTVFTKNDVRTENDYSSVNVVVD